MSKWADVHLEMTVWGKVENLFRGMDRNVVETSRIDKNRCWQIDKNRCWGKARLESDTMVGTHDKNFRI